MEKRIWESPKSKSLRPVLTGRFRRRSGPVGVRILFPPGRGRRRC